MHWKLKYLTFLKIIVYFRMLKKCPGALINNTRMLLLFETLKREEEREDRTCKNKYY